MIDSRAGTSSLMVGDGFFTRVRKYLNADHQRLSPRGMLTFILTGLILAGAALLSIVWLVVGWGPVLHEVRHIAWIWLVVAAGATIASHIGYLLAYREGARHQHGPEIHPARGPPPQRRTGDPPGTGRRSRCDRLRSRGPARRVRARQRRTVRARRQQQ